MPVKRWDDHSVDLGQSAITLGDAAGDAAGGVVSDPQLIAVLAALGHGLRLNLWRLLLPHGQDGLSAGTIALRMSILPSSLSFHLRQMTQAGILVQRRSSRRIIYAVNQDIMTGLTALIATPSASSDVLARA